MLERSKLPLTCTDTPILVFRSKRVSWTDVLPDFGTRSGLVRPYGAARSFPSAGAGQSEVEGVQIAADHILFPECGAYNLLTQLGPFKFLILPEQKTPEDVVAIGRFVSANVVHSGYDVNVCTYGDFITNTIFYPNLFYKLFYSDQPLGLICGQVSLTLCALFQSIGYPTRQVWFSDAAGDGHFSTEVFDGNRWVLIDADFDSVVRDGATGRLVDADAIASAQSPEVRRNLQVEALSHKFWIRGESAFLWGFFGSFTWKPDHHNTHLASLDFLSSIERMNIVQRRATTIREGWISALGDA